MGRATLLTCETASAVAAFVREWHGATREEFLAAYQAPFLLGEPAGAAGAGKFDTSGVPSRAPAVVPGDRPTDRAEKPARSYVPDRLVAIVKRAGAPFPHMISVGRALNNDVVLPYGTVSKLHAVFTPPARPGDGWGLQDAGSMNGTFLDRQPLRAHFRVAVKDSARLVFGEVALLFVLPETLHDILGELARRFVRAGL